MFTNWVTAMGSPSLIPGSKMLANGHVLAKYFKEYRQNGNDFLLSRIAGAVVLNHPWNGTTQIHHRQSSHYLLQTRWCWHFFSTKRLERTSVQTCTMKIWMFHQDIRRKRTGNLSRGVIPLHDNNRPHVANAVKENIHLN